MEAGTPWGPHGDSIRNGVIIGMGTPQGPHRDGVVIGMGTIWGPHKGWEHHGDDGDTMGTS